MRCDFVVRNSKPRSSHGRSAVPGAPTTSDWGAADTDSTLPPPPPRLLDGERSADVEVGTRVPAGGTNARHDVVAATARRGRIDDGILMVTVSSGGGDTERLLL